MVIASFFGNITFTAQNSDLFYICAQNRHPNIQTGSFSIFIHASEFNVNSAQSNCSSSECIWDLGFSSSDTVVLRGPYPPTPSPFIGPDDFFQVDVHYFVRTEFSATLWFLVFSFLVFILICGCFSKIGRASFDPLWHWPNRNRQFTYESIPDTSQHYQEIQF